MRLTSSCLIVGMLPWIYSCASIQGLKSTEKKAPLRGSVRLTQDSNRNFVITVKLKAKTFTEAINSKYLIWMTVKANGTVCLGTVSGILTAEGGQSVIHLNYTSAYRPSAIYITAHQSADSLISRDKIIFTANL